MEDIEKQLPSQERAEELREIFSEYSQFLEEDIYSPWKGKVICIVERSDDETVDDVREAMNFIGAIVDSVEEQPDGSVKLFSGGYYHHIGA
jgi:hypothetical protein